MLWMNSELEIDENRLYGLFLDRKVSGMQRSRVSANDREHSTRNRMKRKMLMNKEYRLVSMMDDHLTLKMCESRIHLRRSILQGTCLGAWKNLSTRLRSFQEIR